MQEEVVSSSVSGEDEITLDSDEGVDWPREVRESDERRVIVSRITVFWRSASLLFDSSTFLLDSNPIQT